MYLPFYMYQSSQALFQLRSIVIVNINKMHHMWAEIRSKGLQRDIKGNIAALAGLFHNRTPKYGE